MAPTPSPVAPDTVAIVGAGLIGRAWAVVFARSGWDVRLSDPHAPTLDAAPGLIAAELHALHAHGLVPEPAAAAARVTATRVTATAVPAIRACDPSRREEDGESEESVPHARQ